MMYLTNKRIGAFLLGLMLLTAGGCANKEVVPLPGNGQQANQEAAFKEKTVMEQFNTLLQKKDVTVQETIHYIDENIGLVSPANASVMVVGLEKVQREKLPALQDKFGNSEAVQTVLAKNYRKGLTSQVVNNLDNPEAKALITETQSSGLKIETAEGMFFPVIDYSAYQKYSKAVTQDIAAYIEIMGIESDKTPVKDAAMMINWSEVVKRAMTQEQFLQDYRSSAKTEEVKQMLKRYTVFAMYGANNTPLFSYDSKQMVPEAKETYLEAGFDPNHGSFSKAMSEFLTVIQRNEYKLTDEVNEYRNKVSKEIS